MRPRASRRVMRPARPTRGYMTLVSRHPILPIKTEAQLDAAQRVIDRLLRRGKLSPQEQGYLEVLGRMVEAYEAVAYPVPEVSDAAMLRHLIDARDVTLSTVAEEAGIAVSTLSAILSGGRQLNRTHIEKLAQYFSVDPGVFLRR